jgi:uncharacterized protein (DUF2236 family)
VRDFRRFALSYLPALFGTALFDQIAMPGVAAGVDWGGRIETDPFARALRSAAADQLLFVADETHAAREAERLVRLHRDVRGTSPDGTRFSARHPENWNWILMSTFRMYRGAYEFVSGRRLTDVENQAVWEQLRARSKLLEHDDERFRLPERHEDVEALYHRLSADRCRRTPTLDRVVRLARRPPPPAQVPRALHPVWRSTVAPVGGRIACALGFNLVSPEIRRLGRLEPSPLDRAIVGVTRPLLRVAFRHLPDRVLLTPLAYHRRKYEHHAARYHSVGLTDFRPAPARPTPTVR